MCSQTVLKAPAVSDKLDYSLHHKWGSPATKVLFPQFGDSVGELKGLTDEEKLTYCGPRTYTVQGDPNKEAIATVTAGNKTSD